MTRARFRMLLMRQRKKVPIQKAIDLFIRGCVQIQLKLSETDLDKIFNMPYARFEMIIKEMEREAKSFNNSFKNKNYGDNKRKTFR